MRREQTTPRGFQTDGGDNAVSSSAQDPRYPRCKVIVAPRTSACASCDLIVTDCLSPRVTKFRLAVNVGPLATTRKPTPSTLPDRVPAALRVELAPGACDRAARRDKSMSPRAETSSPPIGRRGRRSKADPWVARLCALPSPPLKTKIVEPQSGHAKRHARKV